MARFSTLSAVWREGRVQKIVGFLFYGAIVVGLLYMWVANELNQRARTNEAENIRLQVVSSVAAAVRDTQAVDDWPKRLKRGKSYRSGPILTAELEQLWLSGRPILFRGGVRDLEGAGPDDYRLILGASTFEDTFATELRLSLRCGRTAIDRLMVQQPRLLEDAGYTDNLVVVAQVERVRTERGASEDRERRIGDGTCLRIFYVGNHKL
jgi:hypothetical protein